VYVTIDTNKIVTIRNLSAVLSSKDLGDVNLVFHEVGLPDVGGVSWYGDDEWVPTDADRARTVQHSLRDLDGDSVRDLATSVDTVFCSGEQVARTSPSEPLLLFASHLAKSKSLLGSVGDQLAIWGIDLFVAHTSIEPDSEWQYEIEKALNHCHAGVVFLEPGFGASLWCDQEVGWILGRSLPCYALKFDGQDPYGPLGKKQAYSVGHDMTATGIAQVILAWVLSKPSLRPMLNESLVIGLGRSPNFHTTDQMWDILKTVRGLDPSQTKRLLEALQGNNQVYRATGISETNEAESYKFLFLQLATRQAGFPENEAFCRELARSFGIEERLFPGAVDPWGGEPF